MNAKRLVVMVSCLLLTAVGARAEHKLLVTEVLDAGQFEAQAGYEYTREKGKLDGGADHYKVTTQETRYSLNVGLGHGLEVGLAVPFILSEKEQTDLESSERDGFGDLTLATKYHLFGGEGQPVALTVGFDVKLDTASEHHGATGAVEYRPSLAASTELAEHTEGYAVYRGVIVEGEEPDEHSLTVGIEKELSEAVTLDAALRYAYSPSTDLSDSFSTYGAELGAYLQVAHNLYLLPSVGIEQSSSFDRNEAGVAVAIDPDPSWRAGLALYFLH